MPSARVELDIEKSQATYPMQMAGRLSSPQPLKSAPDVVRLVCLAQSRSGRVESHWNP
ncbi:hypothetical protein BDW72DRAFT_177142 [Aspergillus terricola var. indicus]